MSDIVTYFVNGRVLKLSSDRIVYAKLGADTNEEYRPDTANGKAVINWDNVCFVREWQEPEESDDAM